MIEWLIETLIGFLSDFSRALIKSLLELLFSFGQNFKAPMFWQLLINWNFGSLLLNLFIQELLFLKELVLYICFLPFHFLQCFISNIVDFLYHFVEACELIDTFSFFTLYLWDSTWNHAIDFLFDFLKVLDELFGIVINNTVNFVLENGDVFSEFGNDLLKFLLKKHFSLFCGYQLNEVVSVLFNQSLKEVSMCAHAWSYWAHF